MRGLGLHGHGVAVGDPRDIQGLGFRITRNPEEPLRTEHRSYSRPITSTYGAHDAPCPIIQSL